MRKTCVEIGFDAPEKGLDGNNCKVLVHLEEQSPDIGQGASETRHGARRGARGRPIDHTQQCSRKGWELRGGRAIPPRFARARAAPRGRRGAGG